MIVLSSGTDIDFDEGIDPYRRIFKLKGVCIPNKGLQQRDERLVCEDMLRISDDINARYADACRALAKGEAKDRENELLFGFERNAWKDRT